MKLFGDKKAHVSPLSNFALNAKAAQKKELYTKALQEAKKEQIEMMVEGRRILQERASA